MTLRSAKMRGDERQPAKREVRCPKCSNVELSLFESIVCQGSFEQHADGTIDVNGYHSEGSYFRVDAKCHGCKHAWRVKGAKQITDIRDDNAPVISGKCSALADSPALSGK